MAVIALLHDLQAAAEHAQHITIEHSERHGFGWVCESARCSEERSVTSTVRSPARYWSLDQAEAAAVEHSLTNN